MEVKYHGGHPHGYHSAPSGFEYIFQPGVAQKVKPEDEEFFQHMARAPGSHWEVVGMDMGTAAETQKTEPEVAAEPVEEKKTVMKKYGGKR